MARQTFGELENFVKRYVILEDDEGQLAVNWWRCPRRASGLRRARSRRRQRSKVYLKALVRGLP